MDIVAKVLYSGTMKVLQSSWVILLLLLHLKYQESDVLILLPPQRGLCLQWKPVYTLSCLNLFDFLLFILSGNFAPVDVASMMDGKGVIPENTDYSACVMPPPTKRNKLYALFVIYGI